MPLDSPDEVLLDIMCRLSGKDLSSAMCVCHRWCAVASEAWRTLIIRDYGVCKDGRSRFGTMQQYRNEWVWRNRHVAPRKIHNVGHGVFCLQHYNSTIAAGLSLGVVRLYSAATLQLIQELYDHGDDTSTLLVLSIAFLSDEELATGDFNANILLWNISNGNVVKRFKGHTGCVNFIDIDGGLMASGSEDMQIKLWDLERREHTASLSGHQCTVNCGKLNVSLSQLVTGSADKTVKVWDINTFQCIRTILDHPGPVFCLYCVQGKVFTGAEDTSIRVFDIQTGQCLQVLNGHTGSVWSLDVDGDHLVTASDDKMVKLWNIPTGSCLRTFRGHMEGMLVVNVTSTSLISGCQSGTVRIWTFF